jgi:hypothetical protein
MYIHNECIVHVLSIVLHLRSVPILPGWRGYVQSCNAGVEEWTNKFQLDLEVQNIYQDCKCFFSLGIIYIIILRWRVLCFHCSCMMISEIVAELTILCYLASE